MCGFVFDIFGSKEFIINVSEDKSDREASGRGPAAVVLGEQCYFSELSFGHSRR